MYTSKEIKQIWDTKCFNNLALAVVFASLQKAEVKKDKISYILCEALEVLDKMNADDLENAYKEYMLNINTDENIISNFINRIKKH